MRFFLTFRSTHYSLHHSLHSWFWLITERIKQSWTSFHAVQNPALQVQFSLLQRNGTDLFLRLKLHVRLLTCETGVYFSQWTHPALILFCTLFETGVIHSVYPYIINYSQSYISLIKWNVLSIELLTSYILLKQSSINLYLIVFFW